MVGGVLQAVQMAMSGFETRCRAVALLLDEVAPALARRALSRAEAIVRAKLRDGPCGEAVEARLQAVAWLRAAQRRGRIRRG